jgi:two-component system, sensor histidine kinase SagS
MSAGKIVCQGTVPNDPTLGRWQETLTDKPRILLISDSGDGAEQVLAQVANSHEVVVAQSPMRALSLLEREKFAGIFLTSQYFQEALSAGKLLQSEQILNEISDCILLLDADNKILWSNQRLCRWCHRESVVGENFYTLLGSPEILGPDFCPFHTALATNQSTSSTLRSHDNKYFHVDATPLHEGGSPTGHLIVTVRDVTEEIHQQQKLAAIHEAGMELADLTPEELFQMPVKERIGLLKSNILHHTKDLLHFEVAEIRLLDQKTGRLEPLLEMGMAPEAASRVLYAQPQGNGVTGFVAATGKSYLCEDTTEDPLYLEGVRGAKSSLTVPLMLHDQVIGTFNVESPQPKAFSESDLQFLEIFGRDVAAALNTLELLVAEKVSTAAESIEAIHSAVALPVDEILNEAVNVMERYIGHEPDVVERLQKILRNARDIKQVIQKVGQKMAPAEAHPQAMQIEERSNLRGRRILVVDADENVRSAAHALLERYGCVVETAHDGAEAICMVRALLDGAYDVVIADIRLPDVNGYEFMLKLQEIIDPVPLVLMTGFGYDPGHSIVNARKAGLPAYGILYKPFRLDQLLDAVERVVQSPGAVGQT